MMEYRDRGKIWLVDAAIGTETGKFKGYVRKKRKLEPKTVLVVVSRRLV